MFGQTLRCKVCNQYAPDRCRCNTELFEARKAQGFAPGGYLCVCLSCDFNFLGDKRAWTCMACADENLKEKS